MNLLSIASGSSGNCIYVGDGQTHILVDAGISGKRIEEGLGTIGLSTADIDAIFVTHEHIDHIAGVGVLSRKQRIPIYATKGTIEGILNTKSVGAIDPMLFHPIATEEVVTIGNLRVDPMPISHDAREPVAYRIYAGEKRLGIITDLGYYTEEIVEGLRDMDALFVEANHDENMLQVGPYPYPLKRRILGDRGHLSNENSGRLLSKVLCDRLKYIVLGHLSKENNMPELAYEAVRLEINMSDNRYHAEDFVLMVAKRNEPMELLVI
ncbi:MAG: MBL fold metallo-hydrolase [Lachnospiraceae bacterium]|nr:MBL fold metallo-hydrolase [Lachnospiraceae bacterium]